MQKVTIPPPSEFPKTDWNARAGIEAASAAGTFSHRPVVRTTNAVIVHMNRVSTIISNIPQNACLTGWSVTAAQ